MQYFTVFLQSISKLKKKHNEYSKNSFNILNKILSDLLENERSKLNRKLIILRKEYQQHQVDVMAQFIPNQAFSESQYVFSRLCAEFEKTSGLLSQNIKNLIEVYVVLYATKNFAQVFSNTISKTVCPIFVFVGKC